MFFKKPFVPNTEDFLLCAPQKAIYNYTLQVESVPLEEIRKASLLAEKLLCDKLDWVGGIEAAKACQVKVYILNSELLNSRAK